MADPSSTPTQFTMPPPPRSLAEAEAGGLTFPTEANPAATDAPPRIVIEQVEPPRRRRSDAVLMIGMLTGLAVIAGALAAAVFLRK
ncbi:MAG: hypothetical protein EBU59_09105 [Planctomycetia bacterium]|jgi:hypothetical protein|nr:hypothetical protein [Planctomycetia bacterium]